MKIYFAILLSFASSLILAQEGDSLVVQDSIVVEAQDSIIAEVDTIPRPPTKYLTGISATFDYGKLVVGFSEFESKLEFTGHLSIIKWQRSELKPAQQIQISGEYGMGKLKPNGAYKNGNYKVVGDYYRLGLDYSRSIDAKNNISIGMRYGAGNFEDEGLVQIQSESDIFEDYTRSFARTNQSATWWEVIIITEGKLFKIYNPDEDSKIYKYLDNLYIGGNIRVRFNLDYDAVDPAEDALDIYAIPGFGRTGDKTVPAFNLFIKYRLDFD